MNRCMLALLICLLASPAQAWNGGGHRLVASIAWQRLAPATREQMAALLARHPDHARWVDKAKSDAPSAIFAEASTWPDDIRNDPRFHDETREPPTPAIPGLPDNARHKRWHYVDLTPAGEVHDGEADRQIERLADVLRSTSDSSQLSWALPWLVHLVADIHQPLHAGRADDEGGNRVEIENPFNRRQPFTKLHSYWDDLPAPPWLRGARLDRIAMALLERYPPPIQGDVRRWRDESHRLLARAYPTTSGSLLPIVSEEFHQAAQTIAGQRIVEAGYRLGNLLNDIVAHRVSRETR